jgi:hypothetical protein
MIDKEYIVYNGEAFTIEWYYDQKGKSQPRDFYEKLDKDQRIQLLKLVKTIWSYRPDS